MAKVFSVIVVLCYVFSCLIVISHSADKKSIDYNSYHVAGSLQNIETYSMNIRRRRQTAVQQQTIQNAPDRPMSTSESSSSVELSTNATTPLVSNNSSVSNRPSQSLSENDSSDNSSKSVNGISIKQWPLLGVNGTGQRKSFTVSDPITDLSNTTKSPKTVQSSNNESSESSESIIDNIDVPIEDTQKLAQQNNITMFNESYFVFYNSSSTIDPERVDSYWNAFKNLTVSAMLSKSHRRAITVQLTFDFPFYGHPVRNVTVATGGFLYTGEYVHSWLAATQYIAPLMANFDTSLSNSSFVRFSDNGTAFTVVWENVSLQDRPDVGLFTFSVTLHKSGDIVFAYYSLPMLIETIQDDKHPVKIGLSDAYIIDKTIFFARRKTIYEYHRVNFDGGDISNNTIIVLTANPTCHSLTNCEDCVNSEAKLAFKCFWCPTLNKCSTGTDRKRQEWLQQSCDRTQITDASTCPAKGTKGNNYGSVQDIEIKDVSGSGDKYMTGDAPTMKVRNDNDVHVSNSEELSLDDSSGVGMALGLFVPIILIISLVLWVFYAYRNPHTKSGQLLIQYRPSQWSWRRGEARYTAATIHM